MKMRKICEIDFLVKQFADCGDCVAFVETFFDYMRM